MSNLNIRSLLYFLVVLIGCAIESVYAYTILLDPAGDTLTPGRTIHDMYERSLTYMCAEKIQVLLEKNNFKTVLSRGMGQVKQPFHTAQLANRLPADIVIHISACLNTQGTTSLTIMYSKNHCSLGAHSPAVHTFLDVNNAYRINVDTSKTIAQKLSNHLKKSEHSQGICTISGPFGLPYKPLQGIVPPSIALELELAHTKDINTIGPLIGQLLVDCLIPEQRLS